MELSTSQPRTLRTASIVELRGPLDPHLNPLWSVLPKEL